MLVTYITDRNGRKTEMNSKSPFPCCFNRLTKTKLTFSVVSTFHIAMQVFVVYMASDNCNKAHLLVGTYSTSYFSEGREDKIKLFSDL